MDIHVLGAHNCESKDSRHVCLVIDEVLALDAGALTSGLSWKSQGQLKAILLTHQHYDHIRDIPAIAINRFFNNDSIEVFATQDVHDILTSHMLNGSIYPKFHEFPESNPSIRFTLVEPHRAFHVEGHEVLPVPVNHSKAALGYQIIAPDGKVIFCTGDTGSGLSSCWKHVSPQMLFIEVTAPNAHNEYARDSGHLTPSMLAEELTDFRKIKGYLPKVILVHMSPQMEEEIAAEVALISRELAVSINLANEGMRVHL